MQSSITEILLIEDIPAEAGLIKEMLSESRQQMFSVQHVRSLAEGLSLLRSRSFAAVLVDLVLPDSQGLETALAVRNQSIMTPVVVITVQDDEDTALKLLQLDIQDYLLKDELNSRLLLRSIRYAIQRKRDTETLRESETHYRTLFNSIDEGFCIIEIIFDENDKPIDYNFLETNPSFEKQTGLTDARGKRMREIAPKHEEYWFGIYGRIALTGKPERFQNQAAQLHRWYDVYAFRCGRPENRHVAVLFNDITESKKAESARLEAEQKLRDIVEHSTNLFYIHTVDNVLTYVSPQARQFFDCEPEEAQVRWTEFITDNPANLLAIEATQRAIDSGQRQPPYLVECVGRTGRKIWAEVNETPVVEMGKTVAVVGSLTNITDRKRADEEREQLLVQLDAVLNSISEGVIISDLEGNVLTMNPSALAIHDYESVEQVCRHMHLYQEIFELSGLDGLPMPFEQWPLSRALRGERFADLEVHVKRKDTGKSRICSYSGTPVQTRSGDVILAVITLRDITGRKQAEAEIQRLASFPLMNPNPVLELDANGQITFCNPAAEKILENVCYDTGSNPFIPQDLPLLLQDLQDKKTDRFIREIEMNGCYFEELIYVAPPFKSVRIYTMDITKRKRAEEQIEILNTSLAARAAELEVVNRELEAFNYTVAHDLRKPLTVVNGYCQAIQELCGSKFDEECKGYLREAYDGTLRMNRLIGALLDFSRMAHVEPRREQVDLSAMAHEAAAELQLVEPDRKVTFLITDDVGAEGDANLLRVVLDNLLGNAWKYNSTRAAVIIEFGATEINGKRAYFVRDNGTGFDMADANRLFAPFQRLPGAEKCKGFGIGLATVERIIGRHGGKVWAEGEPGKGATFYFTLTP